MLSTLTGSDRGVLPPKNMVYKIICRRGLKVLNSNGTDLFLSEDQNDSSQYFSLVEKGHSAACLVHLNSHGMVRFYRTEGAHAVVCNLAQEDIHHCSRYVIQHPPHGPFYNIVQRLNRKYLYCQDNVVRMGNEGCSDQNRAKFIFEPNYQLRGVIKDFRTTANIGHMMKQKQTQITLATYHTASNTTPDVTATSRIGFREEFESSVSLEIKQTKATHKSARLTANVKADGFVGIFKVAGKLSTDMSYDEITTSDKCYSHTSTLRSSISGETTVTLGPGQSAIVSTFVMGVKDLEIPFEAIYEISGRADMVDSNLHVRSMVPVDLKCLQYLLWKDGFRGGKHIVGTTASSILVKVKGVCRVSNGMTVGTTIEPKT